MTIPDPTEEIKAIRHRMGAEFDYDLDRIVADLKQREAKSNRKYVSFPPRRIADDNALSRSDDQRGNSMDNQPSPP